MNEIATRPSFGTGLISREDLAKSLNNAAVSMPSVGGDKQYIKMLTKGRDAGTWVFGQQETEVEEGSLWAINPMSVKHGYVAWDTEGGGAPKEEIMVSINRPLPAKDQLPVLGQSTPDKKGNTHQLEYQDQRSIDVVCISGEDEGTIVEYKQSSTGAMKLFAKIINALLDQVQKGDDIVAVGRWGFSTYEHTKYGEIYNPEFEIVEWRTVEDTSPAAPADEPEAKEEAPARTRRAEKDPAKDAAAADEEAKLAAEYEEAAQGQTEGAAPRRRQRR